MKNNTVSLYDRRGERKYLNQEERLRFLNVANDQTTSVRLFCLIIYYTGARIAETHNLTPENSDQSNGTIVIETLKKRKKGVYREVPIPDFLLNDLDVYVRDNQLKPRRSLWPFSLRTASRKVKSVMTRANIDGVKGSAKGLRHGFAVHAVRLAPLTLVKRWLGHSRLETTEIYLNIMGSEEREIASQLWGFGELREAG